mgnify:CR=1 FL=1
MYANSILFPKLLSNNLSSIHFTFINEPNVNIHCFIFPIATKKYDICKLIFLKHNLWVIFLI